MGEEYAGTEPALRAMLVIVVARMVIRALSTAFGVRQEVGATIVAFADEGVALPHRRRPCLDLRARPASRRHRPSTQTDAPARLAVVIGPEVGQRGRLLAMG